MTTITKIRNPIFCALDTSDLGQATSWAAKLADTVGGVKLGMEFFNARGPKGIAEVTRACELPLFLDLKFHDIPNTVAGAVKSVVPLKPAIMTIHAVGGRVMMEAAAKAAREAAEEYLVDRPLLMGVTVLTSMGDEDLNETGVAGATFDQVRRLAELAKMAGLDGVICSPHEAEILRKDLGPNFKLITPGVRPVWAAANDQKRIMTPAEALAAGADYVVIGRPITAAPDQAAAAKRIVMELAA